MTMGMGLPPGAELIDGRVMRRLKVHTNGREREILRPVAFSLEDARKNEADYFDEELGWIRNGRKTERENPLPPAIRTMIRSPRAES